MGLVRRIARSRTAAWVATLASVLVIGAATLFPAPGAQTPSGICILCGEFGLTDFALNTLLFAPFGFALRWAGVSFRRCLLLAFAYTFTIELLQLSIIDGRDSSLGDVVANTLGGALGAGSFGVLGGIIRPTAARASRLAALWSAVVVGSAAFTGWAFQPELPRDVYWGQVGRLLRDFAPFGGTIHRTSLNGAPMHDGRIASSDSLRAVLQRDGVRLEAELTPEEASRWISPIAVLATDHRVEVATLSLGRNALVYAGRTRANRLGLRAPFVSLADTFATGHRVVVSAEQRGSTVTLRSTPVDGGSGREARVRFGPELGWILFIPWDTWIGDDKAAIEILSAVWLAALALPLAYWGTLAGAQPRRIRGAALAALVALVGFVLVPSWLALRLPGPAAWVGVALGALAGVQIALAPARAAGGSPSDARAHGGRRAPVSGAA